MAVADPIARLVAELARLPGIGEKTAQRLAFHILNAVDIPIGAVAAKVTPKDGGPPQLAFEQTQWATVHDLANRTCYFRTYGDLTIRKVDLRRVDFTGKKILHVPVPTTMQAVDATAQAR